jgi:hypothetical protein
VDLIAVASDDKTLTLLTTSNIKIQVDSEQVA